MIEIAVYGQLSHSTGEHQLTAAADNLKDLISILSERYGEAFKKAVKGAKIFHNGKNVAFGRGLKTPLQSGDKVVFLSPVAGG